MKGWIMTAIVSAALCASASASTPVVITPEAEARAKDIVSKMTLQEKIRYISGYDTFSIIAVPRLGLPEVKMADGPQGVRNNTRSTLYPCGILSAATWNRELNNRLGRGIGRDAKARGVGFMLGPGVNIYRAPQCGRNFEYFGEDPYLAGEVAKNYILGMQDEGVIATIKHFAANNQEWDRHRTSTDVDERTLHEIYLEVFRKAVEEAHVGAVMNSYNMLNGVHTSENEWLNIDVLRNTWGFKGTLMSDWVSVYSAVGAANCGIDLEMPSGIWLNEEKLMPLIKNGVVPEKNIDKKVQHILQTLIAFGCLDKKPAASSAAVTEDDPESTATALAVAREGIVLLKNEGGALPLKGGKTAILGPNADVKVTGGGSGQVDPINYVTPVQGLRAKLGDRLVVVPNDDLFASAVFFTDETMKTPGFAAEYYKNKNLEGEPARKQVDQKIDFNWVDAAPFEDFPKNGFSARWTGVYKSERDGSIRLCLGGDDGFRLFVNDKEFFGDWGTHSFKSTDKTLKVKAGETYKIRIEYFQDMGDARVFFTTTDSLKNDVLKKELAEVDNIVLVLGFNAASEGEGKDRPFELPGLQQDMIDVVAALNKRLIIVVNAGGGVDFSAWAEKAAAVLMAWYPGQEGGTALAEILTGEISPSGKLPISVESKWEDNPVHDSYYENQSSDYKRILYSEGVFMGYRGYDSSKIKPYYPFGFGLSYSTFEYSDLAVEKLGGDTVRVTFSVKNTGAMDAAEAAQVYVHDVKSSVPRPYKELKGYDKVFLKKGETKKITVELEPSAFKYYDMTKHAFVLEPGVFEILVGPSSAELPLKASVEL